MKFINANLLDKDKNCNRLNEVQVLEIYIGRL